MVTIIKCKKSTIDHAIYIKVYTDGTVSYLTFYTDNVLNTTNNETAFPELRRGFEESFDMKVQEVSVLKYLHFLIFQSPLGFSVYQTDDIVELVNEWFPTGKFIKVDTPFRAYSIYEKYLMATLPLTGNSFRKAERYGLEFIKGMSC